MKSKWQPKCLNYCKIYILYRKFINVAAGHIIQTGETHAARGSQVGYQRLRNCRI